MPTPARLSPLQRGRFQRWHAEPDPPQEEEGWLLTYLDVMTLLLVMLVVMLAFSEPITRKPPLGRPSAIASGSAEAAGRQPPLPPAGGNVAPPLAPSQAASQGPGPHPPPAPPSGGAAAPATAGQAAAPEAAAPIIDDSVTLLRRDDGLIFRIPSEVLFAPGEAELTPAGKTVIDRLLPALNRLPDYTVVVEGHTDNVPIQNARFPSNWELSAARASSVVRHLEARGINPTRLRATGLADTRPIAPNDTAASRAQNRRVEITLEPPLRPAR
ncbi:Motility protein B [Tepidimonas alkaliphilus]|uniref:Motility protein B n=1 Tax=Tepidimonas alkaliphilus TaxID=2588942 RepID=A0A554WD29_9BURK|nr:OmpA family protein [Tepidimonas alkaliphilus]TSE21479.1 Motility protein B [Tepidimonas alkaliphilus]